MKNKRYNHCFASFRFLYLFYTSCKDLAKRKKKIEKSKLVGAAIARKATELGLKEVKFDRGGYLYDGRVKAVADGAREGGLQF